MDGAIWNDFFDALLKIDDRFIFIVKWKNDKGFLIEICWLLAHCGDIRLKDDIITYFDIDGKEQSWALGDPNFDPVAVFDMIKKNYDKSLSLENRHGKKGRR